MGERWGRVRDWPRWAGARGATALLVVVLAASGCGGSGEAASRGEAAPTSAGQLETETGGAAGFVPAEFDARVDNPLLPLASLHLTVLDGTARNEVTGETVSARVEARVLEATEVVAGVPVTGHVP